MTADIKAMLVEDELSRRLAELAAVVDQLEAQRERRLWLQTLRTRDRTVSLAPVSPIGSALPGQRAAG